FQIFTVLLQRCAWKTLLQVCDHGGVLIPQQNGRYPIIGDRQQQPAEAAMAGGKTQMLGQGFHGSSGKMISDQCRTMGERRPVPGGSDIAAAEPWAGHIWSPPSLQGLSFDGKSRLSVVYPASVCSTVLRASMSSRHVSSLSSSRPV